MRIHRADQGYFISNIERPDGAYWAPGERRSYSSLTQPGLWHVWVENAGWSRSRQVGFDEAIKYVVDGARVGEANSENS